MKHNIYWAPVAWLDYLYWQETEKKLVKKINALIKAIDRDSFKGEGKPEPLKHGYQGYWSRHIDKEHRLIYNVANNDIIIIGCRYHYPNSH